MVLVLAACFSGNPSSTGWNPTQPVERAGETAPTGDDSDGGCQSNSVLAAVQGNNDWYYRSNLEFILARPDSAATVETDIPGSLQTSADGLTLTWVLAAPLVPSTHYSALLKLCSQEVAIEFTTSAFGLPVADPEALVGATFELDLSTARFVEPASVATLLAGEFGELPVYVSVTSVNGATMGIRGALGRTSSSGTHEQDYCSPTAELPAADFSGSSHVTPLNGGSWLMPMAGVLVDVYDAELSGDFSSDGRHSGGGVIAGTLDARRLDETLFGGETGAFCVTLQSLGASCGACADGQPECLDFRIEAIAGSRVARDLLVVEGAGCAGCAEGVPEDRSATCPTG